MSNTESFHSPKPRLAAFRWQPVFVILGAIFFVYCVTLPNLGSRGIDDLDSAHHLMDGYFFRDLLSDHPLHPAAYALAYYKQYPALGFLFWPPLIPAVFGLFCLAGGVHIAVVRACLFCYGIIFCLSFYALLRRRVSTYMSIVGVIVVATVPGVIWSFNQIMLEMPTLALMFLAVLAYFNFVEQLDKPGSYRRAVLCSIVCGSVIYSKQPAWFLLCTLVLDYAVRFWHTRRYKEVWLAAALTVCIELPLAAFTLTFGRANLGQSLGNSTNRIMLQYHSLPRWSMAAWTYYPRLALSRLDIFIVSALLAALLLAATKRNFFRNNVIWFSWLGLAYLTFSYYDNRSPRHATFWWPAWVALAVTAVAALQDKLSPRFRWALPLLLLLPVPSHLASAWKTDYTEYSGVQKPIADVFSLGELGNVLMFGLDKQVLTAVIREHDRKRLTHIYRGERLLTGTKTMADVCHDLQVNTVLIEQGEMQPYIALDGSRQSALHEVLSSSFMRRGKPVALIAYRYTGPVAAKAATVSLSDALTQ